MEGTEQSLLMGAVAHDLKAPLALIRSTAIDSDNQPSDLKQIANFAQQGLQLVDDLLNAYRLQNDQAELNLHPVLIRDLLTVDYLSLNPKQHKRLIINNKANSRKQWLVQANGQLLRRCLANLITNSLKYSQGKVSLRAIELDKQTMAIEVKDFGAPISKVDTRALGGQLANYNSRRSADQSGLGLFLVGQMVRAMHGSAELISTDSGNVSLIMLPRINQLSLFENDSFNS